MEVLHYIPHKPVFFIWNCQLKIRQINLHQ